MPNVNCYKFRVWLWLQAGTEILILSTAGHQEAPDELLKYSQCKQAL